ncbi:MAG: metal-dependent hydrolase [Burkholderiales bacterium]|nr:metal-dependent hydrolase [Burkholderiales bacterium]
MDTITHALSGALLARAMARGARAPGVPTTAQLVVAGTVAATFPDGDIVTSLFSSLAYLTAHRGVTHSLLVLPLWAALLAFVMGLVTRKPMRGYLAVCAGGLAIHILGDLITSFGTMVLAPFSDRRFAIGTTFIIDLMLSGIIVLALAASAFWRQSRVPATLGLALVIAYVGFQGWMRAEAESVGQRLALSEGWSDATVVALPRPPLPSNWTVVVSHGEQYRYGHVNLWRETIPAGDTGDGLIAAIHAAFRPATALQWQAATRYGTDPALQPVVREAWNAADFAVYRWFAELPALYRVDAGNPSLCAWFEDLRFLTPGRASVPFRFGVCRQERGPWQGFRLTPEGPRPLD